MPLTRTRSHTTDAHTHRRYHAPKTGAQLMEVFAASHPLSVNALVQVGGLGVYAVDPETASFCLMLLLELALQPALHPHCICRAPCSRLKHRKQGRATEIAAPADLDGTPPARLGGLCTPPDAGRAADQAPNAPPAAQPAGADKRRKRSLPDSARLGAADRPGRGSSARAAAPSCRLKVRAARCFPTALA